MAAPRLRHRIGIESVTVLNIYIGAVITAGALILAASALDTSSTISQSYAEFWLLAALVALGEFLPVKTSDGHGEITTSTIFTFALLLKFGTAAAILAQAIASTMADLAVQKRPWKVAFNISQYTLALAAGGAVLGFTSGSELFGPLQELDRGSFLPTLLAGAVFFVLNSWLPRIGMALSEKIPVSRALMEDFFYQASLNGVLLALSPIVVVVGNQDLVYIPLLAVPMAIVYRSATVHAERDYKAYLALHDSLTGLPNRSLFYDRAEQSIAHSRRTGRDLAVLLIDLDHFKEVNDSLGHRAGDLLLKLIGPRIRSVLRDSDTVARLGGDEFAVLLPDVDGVDHAVQIAKRIESALDEPFLIEEASHVLTLDVEGSIGIALFPDQGDDVETLIQRADVAMYLAKETHTGFEVYEHHRDRHSADHLAMLGDLRRGLDQGELVLHFQPQALMSTGQIQCVETLLRWYSPLRGLVLPSQFIPPAERTGLIHRITQAVVDQAVQQVRKWRDDGVDLRIAVNLARRNLLDLALPELVAESLRHWEVPADCLEFEITESSIIADPERVLQVLDQLSGIGVKLALDDFGVGYSSLSYLKRLPVQEIKIDKSFVMNMMADEDDRVIVRSTIELAHNLGLSVVAEGVENEETWRELLAFGCDSAQGYYIARPGPASDILAVINSSTVNLSTL